MSSLFDILILATYAISASAGPVRRYDNTSVVSVADHRPSAYYVEPSASMMLQSIWKVASEAATSDTCTSSVSTAVDEAGVATNPTTAAAYATTESMDVPTTYAAPSSTVLFSYSPQYPNATTSGVAALPIGGKTSHTTTLTLFTTVPPASGQDSSTTSPPASVSTDDNTSDAVVSYPSSDATSGSTADTAMPSSSSAPLVYGSLALTYTTDTNTNTSAMINPSQYATTYPSESTATTTTGSASGSFPTSSTTAFAYKLSDGISTIYGPSTTTANSTSSIYASVPVATAYGASSTPVTSESAPAPTNYGPSSNAVTVNPIEATSNTLPNASTADLPETSTTTAPTTPTYGAGSSPPTAATSDFAPSSPSYSKHSGTTESSTSSVSYLSGPITIIPIYSSDSSVITTTTTSPPMPSSKNNLHTYSAEQATDLDSSAPSAPTSISTIAGITIVPVNSDGTTVYITTTVTDAGVTATAYVTVHGGGVGGSGGGW